MKKLFCFLILAAIPATAQLGQAPPLRTIACFYAVGGYWLPVATGTNGTALGQPPPLVGGVGVNSGSYYPLACDSSGNLVVTASGGTIAAGTTGQLAVYTGTTALGGTSTPTVTSITATNATVTSTITNNAEFSNGTCTTSKTIAAANGNYQKVTLTAADTCALTFTQPGAGSQIVQLKIIQSSAGGFNGTISGGLWPGGTPPVITASSAAVDIVRCYLDGTNAYCTANQNFH